MRRVASCKPIPPLKMPEGPVLHSQQHARELGLGEVRGTNELRATSSLEGKVLVAGAAFKVIEEG